MEAPPRAPALGDVAAELERARLFGILEELVLWENTTNEEVLKRARTEIWQSWRRACAENAGHPRAAELFDRHTLPAFHDPFAGGGALPLEAQRLGLEAHASDLNPVAVLINKAMIEIPPKFAGRPPVNPESQGEPTIIAKTWRGAQGLAEDVRHYGQWMRDEAKKRIGHLYPPVEVTSALVRERPDLKPYEGRKLTVIAWLWARTVKSPNPAFADVDVPLASTFMLSTKKGKEAYVEPVIEGRGYRPRRVYLAPTAEHEEIAGQAIPEWQPDGDVPARLTGGTCVPYGLTTWGDLFTPRQLVALTTFSDLAGEATTRVLRDAALRDSPRTTGRCGRAYAHAVAGNGNQPFRRSKQQPLHLGLPARELLPRRRVFETCSRQADGTTEKLTRSAIPVVATAVASAGSSRPFAVLLPTSDAASQNST